MCEIIDNQINLVVESAELSSQINIKRAEEAKSRAEKRLARKAENINVERAKLSLLRAVNRLKVSMIR